MLLAIDIGNTNVVCAVFDGVKNTGSIRVESNLNFFGEFSTLTSYAIDGIVISSVVPSLTEIYAETCKNLFHMSPMIIDHQNSALKVDVGDPSEIGADRICNVIAAADGYLLPAIVVDFGTATTYDVVDSDGTFLGGAIAPGIDVSARYLFEKAALLRETAYTMPTTAIGKDTATNLQAGIMYGAMDEVEGMVRRITNEMEWEKRSIILTGGFSSLLSPGLSIEHHLAPELTLVGMRLIYEKYHS